MQKKLALLGFALSIAFIAKADMWDAPVSHWLLLGYILLVFPILFWFANIAVALMTYLNRSVNAVFFWLVELVSFGLGSVALWSIAPELDWRYGIEENWWGFLLFVFIPMGCSGYAIYARLRLKKGIKSQETPEEHMEPSIEANKD